MTAIEPCSCIRLPYTIYFPINNRDPRENIMPVALRCPWSGVFPAATTQFDAAGQC